MNVTRRALLATLIGVTVTPKGVTADGGVHVVGHLGGADAEGGYFELVNAEDVGAKDLILATPIRSPLYPNLKALVGKKVQVSVFEP